MIRRGARRRRRPERRAGCPASAERARRRSGLGPAARARGAEIRRWLLTGVSYMIPFVAAGGLLIALGFLFAGYEIALNDPATAAAVGHRLGAEQLAVEPADQHASPNLHGGLARLPRRGAASHRRRWRSASSSRRWPATSPSRSPTGPASRPGFIAGAVAVSVSAGFLGGLVGGLIAGFAALWISRLKLPAGGPRPDAGGDHPAARHADRQRPHGPGPRPPLAAALTGLTNWLNGMTGTSAILLGIILGLMMCFDLGGPVNKAAYAFATAGLTAAITTRRRTPARC